MSCQRCGFSKSNTYTAEKLVPKKVELCQADWDSWAWARAFNASVYEKNPLGFLDAFMTKNKDGFYNIDGIPDDPDYRRRLWIRQLARDVKTYTRKITSIKQSHAARESYFNMAMGIEGAKRYASAKLKTFTIEQDVVKKRLGELVEQDPIYQQVLKPILGTGYMTCGTILGEIGAAKTSLCFRHKRVKPITACGCLNRKDKKYREDLADSTIWSTPEQRVYGIQAFPSLSCLKSFFGIGLVNIGSESDPYNVRDFIGKDKSVVVNAARKSILLNDISKLQFRLHKKESWRAYYESEKLNIRSKWLSKYKDNPPAYCVSCAQKKCSKCSGGYHGEWQHGPQWSKGYPHWVCSHTDSDKGGHNFGTAGHIESAAIRKLASTFLTIVYLRWRELELGDSIVLDDTKQSLLCLEQEKVLVAA